MSTKFRKKFVIMHLAISFVVAIVLLLLILLRWFPYPLILLDGAWTALLILLGVDLVLGPLLAWIVISDKKKRHLVIFDLSVIVSIQIAALLYGVYNIYNQRIVALVLYDHYFHLVSYNLSNQDSFSNEKLQYFEGIAYGMINYDDFDSELRPAIERVMYNPELYQKLSVSELSSNNYKRRGLSEQILKQYEGAIVYKIIGKKRHGVAVLDQNNAIIQLTLPD